MNEETAIQRSLELADRADTAMLGTNGDNGYPNTKAMLKMENEGLKVSWFSTNTSSQRVSQLTRDKRACVYLVDTKAFEGLMLVGEVEVLSDAESRQRIWGEGFERYYPKGVNDPDYSVLRFTSRWCNYYHGQHNVNFEV